MSRAAVSTSATPQSRRPPDDAAAVYLFWIPVGAGRHFVREIGRLYEAVAARWERRARCDLYHAALEVQLREDAFVIEIAPVPDGRGRHARGVVAEGSVGTTWLGLSRWFRYEIRCWRNGVIADASDAIAPVQLKTDSARAHRLVALVPTAPTLLWGRDELRLGEMWNSNSVVSWLLRRSAHDLGALSPPEGGRAPGWSAGSALAARAALHARG